MAKRSKIQARRLDTLEAEFLPLLVSSLRACVEGRANPFGQNDHILKAYGGNSPDAERLKRLAREIQMLRSEFGESDAVCDRYLALCSLRGSNTLGEPKLAAAFLAEIEAHQQL